MSLGARLRRSAGALTSLVGSGGVIFFVATIAANGLNFVFHVAMSRMLGPSVYGALGSLLGLATIATLAVSAVQAAITQSVAVHRSEQGSMGDRLRLGPSFVKALVCATICFGAAGALAPWIDRFLHLGSPIPVVLFGLYVGLTILMVVPQGLLLGQLRFTPVAISVIIGTCARLAFGIALVEFHLGLNGAVAASAIGSGVTLLCLLVPSRHELSPNAGGPRLSISFGAGLLSVAALGGVSAFLGVDMLLARHFLSRVDSGYYVAAATAARMALFLPGAIAVIAFPRFAAARGRGSEVRRLLLSSLLLVSALGGLATAVILVVPHLVIGVLFGSRYQAASGALDILAIGAAGMGLLSVLVYFHLSRLSRLATMSWVGVAVAAVLIGLFHATLDQIAWSMLVASAVVVLAMGATAFAGAPSLLRSAIEGELFSSAPPELDLTVVVPYFNPGARLRSTVDQLIQVLSDLDTTFEIITVSDGSTDGSESVLLGCPEELVRCVRLEQNMGKGEALRVGLAMGRGHYLGFIDADGDLPASQVASFVALARSHRPDIVLGSKRHPMSDVVYPPLRQAYSRAWQLAVLVLFRLKVRDTQTGLKLIRRDVLAAVLPRMLEKRFAFDLELLVVANRLGYKRFFEAPVHIQRRFGSTVSFRSARGMLLDLLAIFYRLYILRYYDERDEVLLTTVTSSDEKSTKENQGSASMPLVGDISV